MNDLFNARHAISTLSLNDLCVYCGERQAATWDHIVPVFRGGRNIISNLVPACLTCNSRKGKKTLSEFRRYLKAKGLFWEFETPDPQPIIGTAYYRPGSGFTEFISDDGKVVMNFSEFYAHIYNSKKMENEVLA